ncbi:MAG: hypothetical protein ACPHW0_08070 [Pseudomonadales bacterium]|jgi:hypothetical protein
MQTIKTNITQLIVIGSSLIAVYFSLAQTNGLFGDVRTISEYQPATTLETIDAAKYLKQGVESLQTKDSVDKHKYGPAFLTNHISKQEVYDLGHSRQTPLRIDDEQFFKILDQDQFYTGRF